jgi:hypothetical protein
MAEKADGDETMSDKTKVVRPVDIDDHFELRKRVARLEVAFAEAISLVAMTHPDHEFLELLVNMVQTPMEPTP